ncbi:MAG: hypothetical protein JJU10_03955 [Idiomarina sp.]|nr:hypothetical protein [Idiomarina sp.]
MNITPLISATLAVVTLLLASDTSASEMTGTRLSHDHIKAHTTYFDVSNGEILGANTLLEELEKSHFVALGELHNRERLGELTEALLVILNSFGFDYFAVETGPYSARKLQALIGTGESDVSAFYAGYSSSLFDLIPVPFFKGLSDLRLLKVADSLGYEMWGVDQEFYFSHAYLIDELARLMGNSLRSSQRAMQRKLKRRLYWMYRRNQIFSGYQLNCRLINNDDFQSYLSSFDSALQPDIQQILAALRATQEIYCLNEQGKASEPVRVSYFLENFDTNFANASAVNSEPKVFLKMGSNHLGRYRNMLNLKDIGNHVKQLAELRGQRSVHIRYLNRFLEGRDMTENSNWQESARLASVGDKERWSLIDLRPLRELLLAGELQVNNFEQREIINYDFMVIPPNDEWVERHW